MALYPRRLVQGTHHSAAIKPSSGSGDPWVQLDGRLAAISGPGAFQASTRLDGYNTGFGGGVNGRYRAVNGSYAVNVSGRRQPPWMVAGVDYPVGCPIASGSFGSNVAVSGGVFTTAFKNAIQNPPNSCTFGTTFYQDGKIAEIVSGTQLVLDSWDLTGVMIMGSGIPANPQFTKCLLGGGTSGWWYAGNQVGGGWQTAMVQGLTGGVFKYCTFQGLAGNTACQAVGTVSTFIGTGAPIDIRYCYFPNFPGECINVASGSGVGNVIFKYNAIDNFSQGYLGDAFVSRLDDNGAGKMRVTLDRDTGYPASGSIVISDVPGNPNGINNFWACTRISSPGSPTVVDLTSLSSAGAPGATTGSAATGNGGNPAQPGAPQASHMNWMQWPSSNGPSVFDIEFNYGFQNSTGAEGFQLYYNAGGTFNAGCVMSYNTAHGSNYSAIFHPANITENNPQTILGCTIDGNFADHGVCSAIFYQSGGGPNAGFSFNVVDNNINMPDGKRINRDDTLT